MRALVLFFLFLAISPCLADTNDIYALMCMALHPRMAAQLATLDEEYAHQSPTQALHYNSSNPSNPPILQPSILPSDRILDWIIHVSIPDVTNETAFFDSYKTPVPRSISTSFLHLLTNRAARLSYIPPIVDLSLVYDDGTPNAVSRAVPGVDYPGLEAEDVGTMPNRICLHLRAPKVNRKFVVRADVVSSQHGDFEFTWIELCGRAHCPKWAAKTLFSTSEKRCVFTRRSPGLKAAVSVAAVFVRRKGGLWGPPSFIQVENDEYGSMRIVNRGLEIDYDNFTDCYDTDERGNVCGFVRKRPGDLFGQKYSNLGELIVETHSEDHPKTTQKVRYFVKDGKLEYEILSGLIHHKNETVDVRSNKW